MEQHLFRALQVGPRVEQDLTMRTLGAIWATRPRLGMLLPGRGLKDKKAKEARSIVSAL